MLKISKSLTNVICIKGESEEIKEYIESVKDNNIEIILESFPHNLKKKTEITKYINTEWKIKELGNKVIVAKCGENKAYVLFSNDGLEDALINIAKMMELNMKYKYLITDDENSIITTERYTSGELSDVKESAYFKTNRYSVAKCLV